MKANNEEGRRRVNVYISFAQVRICHHKLSGEQRVVKIMSKPYSRQDFELETSLLRQAGDGSCKYVVKYYEDFEDRHFFYSVMEYCSGGELFEYLDSTGPVTESLIASWMQQILGGISFIHKLGIVHRDIKPQNFLFVDESKSVIKLIDFGLSYRMPPRSLLVDPCGTPEFVAPEMVLGRYGRKIDIWSVGILCYLIMFGKCPFSGISEKELFRNIVEKEPSWSADPSLASYCPSQTGVDFCKMLLQKNFNTRPTADQALTHPWIYKRDWDETSNRVITQDVRRRARLTSLAIDHPTKERSSFVNSVPPINELQKNIYDPFGELPEEPASTNLPFSAYGRGSQGDKSQKKASQNDVSEGSPAEESQVTGESQIPPSEHPIHSQIPLSPDGTSRSSDGKHILPHPTLPRTNLSPNRSPKAGTPTASSRKASRTKALSPKTLSPKTLSPKTLSPKTLSPKTPSPKKLSPKTLSPNHLSPKSLSPKEDQTGSRRRSSSGDSERKNFANRISQRMMTLGRPKGKAQINSKIKDNATVATRVNVQQYEQQFAELSTLRKDFQAQSKLQFSSALKDFAANSDEGDYGG